MGWVVWTDPILANSNLSKTRRSIVVSSSCFLLGKGIQLDRKVESLLSGRMAFITVGPKLYLRLETLDHKKHN